MGEIQLRGHHLCCLLTYVGKGYNPDFIKNIDSVVGKIAQGAEVVIVRDFDDICTLSGKGACPHLDRCDREDMRRRDQIMLDNLVFAGFGPSSWLQASRLEFDERLVWAFRRAAARGVFSSVCEGCAWTEVCRQVIVKEFEGVKIFPPKPIGPREFFAQCKM